MRSLNSLFDRDSHLNVITDILDKHVSLLETLTKSVDLLERRIVALERAQKKPSPDQEKRTTVVEGKHR